MDFVTTELASAIPATSASIVLKNVRRTAPHSELVRTRNVSAIPTTTGPVVKTFATTTAVAMVSARKLILSADYACVIPDIKETTAQSLSRAQTSALAMVFATRRSASVTRAGVYTPTTDSPR